VLTAISYAVTTVRLSVRARAGRSVGFLGDGRCTQWAGDRLRRRGR
jgi:hypothetical protein